MAGDGSDHAVVVPHRAFAHQVGIFQRDDIVQHHRAGDVAAFLQPVVEERHRQAKLADASVTISANASTEGKLYGSVGPREIAEAITKQLGVEVGKSEVVMGEGPLRHTGEHDVIVHLHADVESTVKVIVVAA